MFRRLAFPVLALSTLVLSGCDVFDDDDDNPLVETAAIRVLHASPDAPSVNVLIDNEAFVENAPFKAGTGFSVVPTGTYSVQVDGITPDGTATVIGPVDVDVAADT